MTKEKMNEMIRRFNKFDEDQPEQIVLSNARIDGGDLVLKKQELGGLLVYSAPFDVPMVKDMKF